jgi:hypothetical protein
MKALAEFAMRGRRQAALVAVVATALPMLFLLGAAIVGLLFLRRGWSEGVTVLPWPLLVAGLWWWLGDPTAFIVMVMVVVQALLLRARVSWQPVWMAGIALATLVMLALNLWPLAGIEQLVQMTSQMMQSQLGEQWAGVEPQVTGWLNRVVVAMLAASDLLFALLCLMLARHWQSVLYHPGGFRQEFHGFKVARAVGAAAAVDHAGGNGAVAAGRPLAAAAGSALHAGGCRAGSWPGSGTESGQGVADRLLSDAGRGSALYGAAVGVGGFFGRLVRFSWACRRDLKGFSSHPRCDRP